MIIYSARARQRLAALAAVATLAASATARAQQPAAGWRFTAPDAAAAWFHTLGTLRLAGPGAFAFYRATAPADTPLARTLGAASTYEILHFAPLYYPSASRPALVLAVRDAAAAAAAPSTPRAAFLVGALASTLPTPAQRAPLGELAAAVERSNAPAVSAAALERWQRAWDSRFALPLEPYLRSERLDGGIVMVAAALGPEGRLFAGRPADRTDNVAAVGTLDAATDADAPVFALVRELCFPLVSRAADRAPALKASRADAARRTSIAAVRCGAELLDHLLPTEAGAYRTHWTQVAAVGGNTDFDTLFPPDPVLASRIRTAIARIAPRP